MSFFAFFLSRSTALTVIKRLRLLSVNVEVIVSNPGSEEENDILVFDVAE